MLATIFSRLLFLWLDSRFGVCACIIAEDAENGKDGEATSSSLVARKCDDVLGLQPDGKFVIRADITNAEEANRWLRDYSLRTDTNWVASRTYPHVQTLVWRKDYRCHHTGTITFS